MLITIQQRYYQDFMWPSLPALAQYFPRLADMLTEIIREDVTAVTRGAWPGLFVLYISHSFILLLCVPSVFHFLSFSVFQFPFFFLDYFCLAQPCFSIGFSDCHLLLWIFPLASAREESVHTYHVQTSATHTRASGSLTARRVHMPEYVWVVLHQ